jgi:serine/threonine-protein kinase
LRESDSRARLTTALEGRYQLDRELGQGGMATVWLANDVRHDRQVALKVLRPELAAVIGAERFLTEIKTTANLQHPHILPLFDSGEADGLLFYVMPLIEGESLRDRLAREKQLPVEEAVRLATEVASALDYAHRHGVIHRDIKPENVLLHDGRALVADFGIALAASRAGDSRMTETGMSLGTPHYMSPEQAMGERDLGPRSDVYSLGAMAYEMLTGEPPYTGNTAQAIVAKVITERPAPITARRDTVPPHVAAAIHRALAKLPADRFATAAAFADALARPGSLDATAYTTAASRAVEAPGRRAARLLPVAGLAAVLAAAAFLAGRRTAPEPAIQPPSRLSIIAEGAGAAGGARLVDISPDGEAVVWSGGGAASGQVYLYRFDAGEAQTLVGTQAGIDIHFGPEGRDIWFVGDGGPMRLGLAAGGSPEPRPRINLGPSAAWAPDGSLWMTDPLSGAIGRLAPGGQAPEERFPRDSTGVAQVQQVLPGGTHALAVEVPFTAITGRLVALDLATGERTPVVETPVTEARYAAGLLIVVRGDGTMEAIPFDAAGFRVTGPPVVIGRNVSVAGSIAQFAVARNGTVAWVPVQPRELVLVERSGNTRSLVPERRSWHNPRFSPDGRRVSVDFVGDDGRDTWVLDRAQGTLTRITFTRDGHDAEWSPDGRTLSFLSFASGSAKVALTRPGSTAPPESLFATASLAWTGAWLPDGSGVVTVVTNSSSQSGFDLAMLRRPEWRIEPLAASPYSEAWPSISPDGRWVAYASNRSGRQEVYVMSLNGGDLQVQVSLDGGSEPVWARTGREIFYRRQVSPTEAELVSAAVEAEPEFRVTARTPLFRVDLMEVSQPHANWDAAPDGQSFVFVRRSPATRIEVIQNLPELVRRLQGTGGPATR